MCEVSAENYSNHHTCSLWGEIEQKGHPPADLWKPLHEYPKIINHAEEKFDFEYEPPEDISKNFLEMYPNYDPVGRHLVKLRKCSNELRIFIKKVENRNIYQKRKQENKDTKKKYNIKEFRPFPLPELPISYPFKGPSEVSVKQYPRIRLRYQRFLQESQVKQQITYFVKQVVLQNGFSMDDSDDDAIPLKCLAYFTEKFLKCFVDRLSVHNNSGLFCERDGLLGPLNVTLHEMRFGGIHGLYDFHKSLIIKQGILLKQCQDLNTKYEKIKNEIPS